ncbi:hypothetical protein MVEN_01654600 [Mycena venus]|uniref:Uncharacterized protein n=1 Tax=Mycena venus TaxID=2733690 RepID=A0A8H7CQV5_9AGAR|nr:hypothetical protein MVEN_01654600 [Mycena venus]
MRVSSPVRVRYAHAHVMSFASRPELRCSARGHGREGLVEDVHTLPAVPRSLGAGGQAWSLVELPGDGPAMEVDTGHHDVLFIRQVSNALDGRSQSFPRSGFSERFPRLDVFSFPWSLYHTARRGALLFRLLHPHLRLHRHPTLRPPAPAPKPPHPSSARSSSTSSPSSSSPRSAFSSGPSPPPAAPKRSANPYRGSARPSSRSLPPSGPYASSSRASHRACPPCIFLHLYHLRRRRRSASRRLQSEGGEGGARAGTMAEREAAMYAYVEDALAPLEKGVRRVERRVGKLRAAKQELVAVAAEASAKGGGMTTTNNTIFVPAPARARPTTVQGLIGSWFSPSPMVSPPTTHAKVRSADLAYERHRQAARAGLDSRGGRGGAFFLFCVLPARTEAYAKQQHIALISLLRQ